MDSLINNNSKAVKVSSWKKRIFQSWFYSFCCFFVAVSDAATPIEIDTMRHKALAYLFLNQDADGFWDGAGKTDIQTTARVLNGFYTNGIAQGISATSALSWLANTHAVSNSALGSQAGVLGRFGWQVDDLLDQLVGNTNGRYAAWGGYAGYQPSFPDTAIVLDAWYLANVINPTASTSTTYIRNTAQNSDGGWSYQTKTILGAASGSSYLIPTAYAVLSLSRSIQLGHGSQTDITEGISWLLTRQQSDGGFADDATVAVGEVFETALVLYALKEAQAASNSTALGAAAAIDSARDFLVATQVINGGWNDDVMATATVLNALDDVVLLDGDEDGIPDVVEPDTGTDPLVADADTLIAGIGDSIAGVTTAEPLSIDAEAGTELSVYLPFTGAGTIVAFHVGAGLPEGVSVNSTTGQLQGAPETTGEHIFSYQIEYADGSTEDRVMSLTVGQPPSLNIPMMPLGYMLALSCLMVLIMVKFKNARKTIFSIGLMSLSIILFLTSKDIHAESAIPEHTAKVITDAFIGVPAKRDETVRSINEHINTLSNALEEYHSVEARKMFAKAERVALTALNKRLNAELKGHQVRRYNNSKSIQLSEVQIAKKEESLNTFFKEIDNLQSANGNEALSAFLEIRKRLQIAEGIYSIDRPIPTLKKIRDVGSKIQFKSSSSIPAYVAADNREWAETAYVFNGDLLLLAAAPSTPTEAQSCSFSPADLADDGKDITLTSEIQALAEQLDYLPAKIFEFVANKIEFQPYYGALKGAHATLLTKSGGATDQSSLLIALLRASNIPARYVRGDIEADIGASFEKDSRVVKWLQADNLAGAFFRLALSGNPAADYFPGDSLVFSHVWVEACVPYAHYQGSSFDLTGHRWIPFDPSFETRRYTQGISTSTQFDINDYLSGFQTKMPEEFYEQKVFSNIVEADKGIKDVGSRSEKIPLTIDVLPTSLPYNVQQFTNWSHTSLPETAVLPDSHRYFFTVETKNSAGVDLGASMTRLVSDIVLTPVTFFYQGSTVPQETTMQNWRLNGGTLPATLDLVPVILIDGVVESTGTGTVKSNTTDNRVDMRVTMDEYRFGLDNTQGCPTVSGTLLINDSCSDTVRAANYHSLQVWGHQGSQNVLDDIASSAIDAVNANPLPASDIHNTLGNFLHYMSLGYMRDFSEGLQRIGQLTNETGDSGLHLGLTGSQSHVESVLDLPFGVLKNGFYVDVPGGFSLSNARDGTLSGINSFLAGGYSGSAYESHIWQETARLDAVSTVRGIQFAKEQGFPVLTINASNQSTELSKLIAMENGNTGSAAYPFGFVSSLQSNFIDNGYEVVIPDRRINYEGWQGEVYTASLDDGSGGYAASFLISGGFAGGFTVSDPVGWHYDPIFDTGYFGGNFSSILRGVVNQGGSIPDINAELNALLQSDYGKIGNGGGSANTFAGDPVNLVTGNFYHTERDLVIPFRDLPFVFERVYNSRIPIDGALGFGWTHSFNHSLLFVDEAPDNEELTNDTDGTTSSLVWIDGTGGEKRIEVNGASASGIGGSATFTLRDGQYFSFVRESDSSYTITEKNGLIYKFEVSAGDVDDKAKLVQIESRNGNTLTLSYNGSELDRVTDTTGRFIEFTYSSSRISRVEDWTGRAHEYTYDADGNLENYSNPLALAGQQAPIIYDYFTAADSATIDHAIKSITLPKGNGMSFEYYVDGRVFRHTNTAGETFTFQYNDFRRETVVTDARGFTKQYFFNEYGNPKEIIDEEGGISTYEYTDTDPYLRTAVVNEARLRTEYEYNAQGTLILQRNPSGSTVEYSDFNTFQQPGKIKDANGNYQLLKYDTAGNITDTIALKIGVGASITPATYTPVEADILSWTRSDFDSAGNIETSTRVRNAVNGEGFSQNWQYDANQLYATEIKRCGDKTGDGVIDLITDDPCDVAALSHDALGRLESGVNGRFEVVEFRYDELGRVVRGTDAVGQIRNFGYDDNGNASSEKLLLEKVGSAFLSRSIDSVPDGSSAFTVVDSSSSNYDASDRLRVSIDAGGNATYYGYDTMGNVETVTNPDNYTIAFEYDGLGRVTSAFDEEGREAKRSIDPIGRMRSLTDPNGNSETFVYYDAANDGRLEKQCEAPKNSSAVARCTTFNYDPNGNVIAITDNVGSMTLTTYDALNRPVRIVEPVYIDPVHGSIRPVTRYTYNLLGNLEKIDAGYTDVLGLASSDVLSTQQISVFDDWGRTLSVTDALGETWVYTYNVSGDLLTEVIPFITTTTAIGSDDLTPRTITREYNYGGLLSKEGGITYEYNPLGQITRAKGRRYSTNASYYSNNYTYTYDNANRLRSEIGVGLTLNYTTSPGGLLEKVDVEYGGVIDTIQYRYDKTGRLQSIDDNGTQQVSYSFDDAGRLIQKRYPGNVNTHYDYFNDNRLKQLLVKGPSATLLQQDFDYDDLGRRNSLTENLNGAVSSSSYGYDNLSRLVSETIDTQTQSFNYDQFGNRITHNKFDGSVDFYEYDVAQQLKAIRDTNGSGAIKARYQYSPNGSLFRRCEGASAANVSSDELIRGECDLRDYRFSEYDEYGELKDLGFYDEPGMQPITHQIFEASNDATAYPDLVQTNFEYDYDYSGRRIEVSGFERQGFEKTYNELLDLYLFSWTESNANPHNTQYRYNGEAIYLSYQTSGSLTNPEARFLQGAGVDEPLVRFGNDGSVTNYHQDGRNSVVLTTNATTGAVVASQQFDAFGNVQASSGSVAQYGFTGREPDASGLMYYRARYYDPGLGRFTQRDPKGFVDGINRYAYVRNNPVNRIDPNGTVSIGTNNYSSLNTNYFSGGGSSSQTLASTNNNFDAGATAQLTQSVGGDTSFLGSLAQGARNIGQSISDEVSFGYSAVVNGIAGDYRDGGITGVIIGATGGRTNSSFLDQVADNFAASSISVGLINNLDKTAASVATAGAITRTYGGYTIGQYALRGPAPHLGTHAATARLVAATTVTNTAIITGSYEAGNAFGSLIRAGVNRIARALE